MNIYMNKFTYEYDSDGKIADAQVGLYGNDSDGEYVSCSLTVKVSELGKDKTFDNVTISDVLNIAKQKALSYLQPDNKKKADATNTTTNTNDPTTADPQA